MTTPVLTNSQKAAAVLLAVGPERAARVLGHLDEESIEQLTVEVATLGDISTVELDAILEEFRTEAVAQQELLRGSEHIARDLLRRVHGDQADEIVDRLLATTQAAPFHFLRVHDPQEVLQHLRDEHPQTIALVLAHLPARLGASLLSGLDVDTQVDVSLRLATLGRTSPDVVAKVEHTLRGRLGEVRRRSDRRDGVRDLADLLNQADRQTERSILGQLEETDAELAERVRALMFLFEDLVTLDDRSLQELLRNVDLQRLATALKGVGDDVRQVIERNLSLRAREGLEEELDLLGPVRIREVEEAQGEIVRLVHEMEESGLIILSRGEEEFVA